MLYFSRRPIDPSLLDLDGQRKLREFKAETIRTALVGEFTDLSDLRATLLRDLTRQVRAIHKRRPSNARKLEEVRDLTDVMIRQREAGISPDEFQSV